MNASWEGAVLEQLLTDCTGGDPLAWRHLLETVRARTLQHARQNYGLERDDAEDLAQQVQIRVAERLSQLREPQAFHYWLRRLIHHAAVDSLRERRLLLSVDVPSGSEIGFQVVWQRITGTEGDDPFDQALLRLALTNALARLPDHYREPIRLHLLEGLPQEEVGRLLGRPRSTVATQIERGLHRLRRLLSGSTTEEL